jgi:hypothetical protein
MRLGISVIELTGYGLARWPEVDIFQGEVITELHLNTLRSKVSSGHVEFERYVDESRLV